MVRKRFESLRPKFGIALLTKLLDNLMFSLEIVCRCYILSHNQVVYLLIGNLLARCGLQDHSCNPAMGLWRQRHYHEFWAHLSHLPKPVPQSDKGKLPHSLLRLVYTKFLLILVFLWVYILVCVTSKTSLFFFFFFLTEFLYEALAVLEVTL